MAEPCAGAGLLRLWGCAFAFIEAVVQFANKKPGSGRGKKINNLEICTYAYGVGRRSVSAAHG
jgi:hypothetical protein